MISTEQRRSAFTAQANQLNRGLEDLRWQNYRRPKSHITCREAQILNCIAHGKSNKEIAYVLGISAQTIKNHVSSILCKLRANDRAHAVALVWRKGLITSHN